MLTTSTGRWPNGQRGFRRSLKGNGHGRVTLRSNHDGAADDVRSRFWAEPGPTSGRARASGHGRERTKEREKIDGCQRQATEQNILPRDRPQFVVRCLDGAAGPALPSVVAPEYQELAAKRVKEKERVDNCQRQASEQKILPRDRPQFVIHCLEK
jgi:hypothetical protein